MEHGFQATLNVMMMEATERRHQQMHQQQVHQFQQQFQRGSSQQSLTQNQHPQRTSSASSSTASTLGVAYTTDLLAGTPFELREGRRYLRNVSYPLPVDLEELQRQSVRTMVLCEAFGRALCSPSVRMSVPHRVLEVACGGGYWSAMCHEYFCTLDRRDVSFTGLDIAPLAPDLRQQGVNWRFVQHDIRQKPWPFTDGEFDLVMLKDVSLAVSVDKPYQAVVEECIRVLSVGGTLEIWESDHVLRCLTPDPPAPGCGLDDQEIAMRTATYPTSTSTTFTLAENDYLKDANKWIAEALDLRRLSATPCVRVAPTLYQEPDSLADIGTRRIAIPLAELQWELERIEFGARGGSRTHSRKSSAAQDSPLSTKGSRGAMLQTTLTSEQVALRQAALLTHVQQIEGLETILRRISGKNVEEWSHWWASMMTELFDPAQRPLAGECLEVGAWWATKIANRS